MPSSDRQAMQAGSPVAPAARGGPRKAAVDGYLADLFKTIEQAKPGDKPSVLISGTIRCGKTKVAKRVALRNGYYHLKTDQVRNSVYLDCAEADKRRIAKYVYRRILLRFPTGVLIDGTGLMDAPCELPLWARSRGITFFAIGYSRDDPAAKHRDLLAYRATHPCWTRRTRTDAEMLRFARRLIRRSQDIKAFCAAHDLPYFDLDSAKFDAERERILHEIERALRARQMSRGAAAQHRLFDRLRFWRQQSPPDT